MKIESFDFGTKRNIIICINNDIINGKMSVQNIHLFDKIFNDFSNEEFGHNAFLFQMWIDVRTSINKYYKNNKALLDSKLKSINDLLNKVVNDNETEKELVKGRNCGYGKR